CWGNKVRGGGAMRGGGGGRGYPREGRPSGWRPRFSLRSTPAHPPASSATRLIAIWPPRNRFLPFSCRCWNSRRRLATLGTCTYLPCVRSTAAEVRALRFSALLKGSRNVLESTT